MPDSLNSPQYKDIDEKVLLEQGRRIRALHEIISRPDLSFDQQIDETLRLGCRLLGTEIGKVGRQDPVNNLSEFLNTVVLSDLPARRGVVLPLDKTFCHITFASPQVIAISHVAMSEYREHPAAAFLGMQSYIGCTINVHGKKFGTVNFSNRHPVAYPFTEADKDLVNLIGSWISVMMERQLESEELRKSREAAVAANQAKSAFLANMSHEIRTPLTSIIGFAEAALDDGQTEHERSEALRIIRQSGDHLLQLINDVLDFSKIEAGELDIEKSSVNLLPLVGEVEAIIKAQAKRKHLHLHVEPHFPLPIRIVSDPLRLKQILLNLCSNAIKFTNAGEVSLHLAYDDNNNVLSISVRDTGIGMTEEQLESIFKPFKQADASISRRFGGTGLGLSLSKRLAELLGGGLTVTSSPGQGSTFTLSLTTPMAGLEPATLARSMDEVQSTYQDEAVQRAEIRLKGEVLVAEDNLINQQLIQRFLQRIGVSVNFAENGAVAVNLALQHKYDLVFMDMQMPVMSGIDAVRVLRDKGYTAPIVMLTANATLEDRKLCIEAGCNDFITKPIMREQLYKITENYLRPPATG